MAIFNISWHCALCIHLMENAEGYGVGGYLRYSHFIVSWMMNETSLSRFGPLNLSPTVHSCKIRPKKISNNLPERCQHIIAKDLWSICDLLNTSFAVYICSIALRDDAILTKVWFIRYTRIRTAVDAKLRLKWEYIIMFVTWDGYMI